MESLTDGLLPEYRQFLPSARCKTLDAWVEIVSNLEADPAIKTRYGHGQLSSIGVPTTNCIIQHCKGCGSGESSSVQKPLMRQGKEKGSDRPSEPCRFCTAAGKRFFHWHKDCWRKKLDEQKVEKSQINNVIMNFNSRAFASFAKIPVQVNSFQTQAILDSGSTVNVDNEDFVRMAKVPVDCRDSTITMAGGTSARISGVASFPLTIESHTQIVEALVMPHFSYFMLLGINIGKFFPVIVDFEQHLAYVKPKEEVQGHSDIHQEVQPELNFHLPIHEARAEVDQLCQKYTDVFDVNNTPFGEFPGEMMRVHLTSDVPVSLRPYRHSALKREIIKSLIEEMLCQGIIRPSTSPYAAPVTLVLKKDRTYRLVVDFRLLNLIAILEMEPMPII